MTSVKKKGSGFQTDYLLSNESSLSLSLCVGAKATGVGAFINIGHRQRDVLRGALRADRGFDAEGIPRVRLRLHNSSSAVSAAPRPWNACCLNCALLRALQSDVPSLTRLLPAFSANVALAAVIDGLADIFDGEGEGLGVARAGQRRAAVVRRLNTSSDQMQLIAVLHFKQIVLRQAVPVSVVGNAVRPSSWRRSKVVAVCVNRHRRRRLVDIGDRLAVSLPMQNRRFDGEA